MFTRILENFTAFKRVPLKVVLITALASYALQIIAITEGQPLYIIAVFTLLPWVPILCFESLWKYEHYGIIAIFAVVTVLQLGHLGEHVAQVVQLKALNGTLACPPPVDTAENAARAVQAGLRAPTDVATGLSAQWVVKPNADGFAARDATGNQVRGPAACGVLGQLDLEIVHLVWELFGWFTTLWLLTRYPRNLWLWVATFFLSVHALEHLFISHIFFFDKNYVFQGTRQLWATTADGKIVTSHPVGQVEVLTNFYGAGGKNGIFGAGGMVANLFGIEQGLPSRAILHFWYNFIITLPTVLAFLTEVRRVHNRYLAQALPRLSEEQLVATTPSLVPRHYRAGDVIVRQGEVADSFYIITKGTVAVVLEQPDGGTLLLDHLGCGQYFGEMGLLQHARRSATVRAVTDVEVMTLDHMAFAALMSASEFSRAEVNRLVRERANRLVLTSLLLEQRFAEG